MKKEDYRLKGNNVLEDDCLLNAWYISLRKRAKVDFNTLNNFPPISMFIQEEDREKIKLIT